MRVLESKLKIIYKSIELVFGTEHAPEGGIRFPKLLSHIIIIVSNTSIPRRRNFPIPHTHAHFIWYILYNLVSQTPRQYCFSNSSGLAPRRRRSKNVIAIKRPTSHTQYPLITIRTCFYPISQPRVRLIRIRSRYAFI